MKIALITDQHFGARADSLALHSHFKKFYDNVFFPYLKDHDIKTVIDLGDTVDRRKYINFLSLHYAKEYYFDVLEARKIDLHMIVGNHSTYHKNSNDVNSSKLLFSRYENVTVYEDATEIEFDDCKILLLPWICLENEENTLNKIETTNAQIAFGHLEIQGFEMYKGSIIQHVGYDSSVFSKFDIVCSGHFHHRSTKGNITYLGCPYEMTWSDFDDRKGFHVFDTETRGLTFIPNPYTLFNKLEYDDTKLTLKMINEMSFEDVRETYVKLVVKNKTNPYFFDLYIDRLQKVEPINLQIIDDVLDMDSDSEISDKTKDTLEILTDCVNELDGFDEKIRLNSLLNEIYHEALRV